MLSYRKQIIRELNGYLRLVLRDRLKTGDYIPTLYIYIYIYTCAGLTLYVHALQKGEKDEEK